MITVRELIDQQFKHFNARETRDAARGWCELIDRGGQMLVTLAGAMSTAELGISLAEMIRREKVHAISCTAANLEEDLFNLLGNKEYEIIPDYRALPVQDEANLYQRGFNRVTDTCIPETIFRDMERILCELWNEAAGANSPKFPWEFMYDLLDVEELKAKYQIQPDHSWVLAAKEKNLPIYSPGFEDSTLGNIYAARVMDGSVKNHNGVRTGTEQMEHLARWYTERADNNVPVGFFQIGGGIAGDFAICVVPMLIQDLENDLPFWAYFAQISDSTTSYGSYSGAVPNEKITWGKLDSDTPKFMINSDASIVAPLIFAYVMSE